MEFSRPRILEWVAISFSKLMADVCKYCSVGDLHLEGCLLEARAAEWGPLRPWLLQGYLLQQTVGSLEGECGRKSQSLLEEGVDRAEASRAFLFQEELANIPRAEQPCPVFQYVLCAATSLAQVNQGALDLGMERGERGASGRLDLGWAGGGRQPLCP